MKETIHKLDRTLDNAVEGLARKTNIDQFYAALIIVMIALTVVSGAFLFGFELGYELSVEHYLYFINKHQIEYGNPLFDREWMFTPNR